MANYLRLYDEHGETGPKAAEYVLSLVKRSKISLNKYCQEAEASRCTLNRWQNNKTKVSIEAFIRLLRVAESHGVRL